MPPDDPSSWTLTRLTDHFAATDHRALKQTAPRAAAYARRIRDVHASQHPELEEVAATCDALTAALQAHLQHEEDVFFPALRRTEQAVRHDTPVAQGDADELVRSLTALPSEHQRFLATVDRLRDLTMDYALPFDACATYDLAYRTLRELDAALRRHLAQEGDLLLPGAALLADRARGGGQTP
jgi:regulator of cell morphogenesis and NO signaling